MVRLKRWLPCLILLAEVLLFHRYTLTGRTIIPWDIRTYHLQQAMFVSKSLHDGELPLWTPYIYCGHPFAANIQAALFYPPRFVASLLGGLSAERMLYSLEVELILHILLAGIFCYLLLRELGLSRVSSLIGATSFQLGTFFASQAEHLGAIEGGAWLPCIWLLLLRLARKFQRRDAVLLSGAMAMPILSGFMPLATVLFMASGFLVLLLVLRRQASPKLIAIFLSSFAGSTLLCAIALFPGIQLMLLSVSRFRTDWMGKGGGLPIKSLYSIFWPGSFGVLTRGAYQGLTDITLMYLYSGALILLGVVSLLIKRKIKPAGIFLVLAFVSALFMLGESTPFGDLYVSVFPALIRRAVYPQEWIAPFALSLCIAGTYGISAYTANRRAGLALLAFAICDLTWFGSNRPFNSTTRAAEPGVSETSFAGSEQLLNAVRYFSNRTKPPSRIDTINDSLDWAGSAMITGVPSANGADPMALIAYMQARRTFAKGERWGYYYQVTDPTSPVLQSLNICCLLTRTRIPPEQLARSAYSNVAEIPGGFLYYSNTAAPRFQLVPPAGKVTVEQYRRNSVSLTTESKGPAVLVSSEANYPGWKATIDGRESPIVNTNLAFRALSIPAGKHKVEFRFAPGLLLFSAGLSAAAWLAFAFLLLR